MSDDSFIPFGRPQIEQAEIDEVVSTLRSGWLGTGPRVARFEDAFAAYRSITARRVAAVNSGTAALHLSLIAAGIGDGDEVIVPAMTFCATVNAVIHAGATPVLTDVALESMNILPASIEQRITPNTKAMIVVHFAGRPCDMDAILAIAARYRLVVIEDCAHAIEAEYRGGKVGTFGDFACFSFYATKNMTTGEGGMLIATDEATIDTVKVLALHGMSRDAWRRYGDAGYQHYEVTAAGYKYNMTDLQAAIGIHQLARIQENLEKREAIWNRYQHAFADLSIACPAEPETDTKHARHLYTVLIDEERSKVSRDQFLMEMTAKKIGVGVHYRSIADHPYYQRHFGFNTADYPNARKIGRQTVSLPLSASLTENDVNRVIGAVMDVFPH